MHGVADVEHADRVGAGDVEVLGGLGKSPEIAPVSGKFSTKCTLSLVSSDAAGTPASAASSVRSTWPPP
jgi:hypothetical protein